MPYLAGKASVAHGKVKITLDHLLPVSPQIQETVGKISRETPAVRATPFLPDGKTFSQFIKITLAANVPQNAYIDTFLPR